MLRLWSVQGKEVADTLASGRIHRVLWEHVSSRDLPAFRTMADAMETHGIIIIDAPVWAWKGAPDDSTVQQVCESLLSDADWERAPHILTLDVPPYIVFLGRYGRGQENHSRIEREPKWSWLFAGADEYPGRTHPSSPRQATLPFLHPSWLVRAEPLRRQR